MLLLAREMGVLKMGTLGLDGTKIHANASRHSALSWEHANKLEAQLKAEVADLLARAEAEDQANVPDGLSIPEELALREKRLAKLAEARAKIEARAKERYERERAEHEAKLAERQAKTAATGKKPGGKPPAPPVEGPLPKDQGWRHTNIEQWLRSRRGALFSVGSAFPDGPQPEEAVSVPVRA